MCWSSSLPSPSPPIWSSSVGLQLVFFRSAFASSFSSDLLLLLTFKDVRQILVGGVGSIRRVLDFVDTWGLVNYSASAKPLKWEDKENKFAGGGGSATESSTVTSKENSKMLCSGCKSVCSIACFYCDKPASSMRLTRGKSTIIDEKLYEIDLDAFDFGSSVLLKNIPNGDVFEASHTGDVYRL
ncbi:hypothetical protein Dsin_001408 [Dipteronia sinensis]|uniref:SWIRM domain-containing protein n=1 Tax=Dipteronia sinensis TaxID=43782 RepID=A0AAE0B536_9ROSI|nr:hypothetical protein Dsin_001408 [Dipteronia sinensis]